MAVLISRATGNFTATSTWKVVETALRAIQAVFTAQTNTTTSDVHNANAQDFTIANGVTIEGIMLYCRRLNTTGTVRVTLSADSGTTATRTVTVNASDLPADASWVFFEFSSTLVGDGGTDYSIAIQGSSAANAAFYRDATAANWAHFIGLSTNPGSVAAGDNFYVVGERTGAGAGSAFTVTMDSTAATDYGTGTAAAFGNGIDIGNGGILQYGASAATNYLLRLSGSVAVWGGGTFNMGTTGTPIPRDSTAILEFDMTATGDIGLVLNAGATCNLQGLSRTVGKNVVSCLLNTDEAAAQTTLGVDTDTGWLNGDEIGIASTSATYSQYEKRTLSGAAGASSLTISAGLTNSHLGTAPKQAEVVLLTRNVRLRSTNSARMFYVGILSASVAFNADWTQFQYCGNTGTNKKGIEVTAALTTAFGFNFCSVHEGNCGGLLMNGVSGGGTISATDNVFYDCGKVTGNSILYDGSQSDLSFATTDYQRNVIVGRVSAAFMAADIRNYSNINGLRISSINGGGLAYGSGAVVPFDGVTLRFRIPENVVIHSCAGSVTYHQARRGGFKALNAWSCVGGVLANNIGDGDIYWLTFEDCIFDTCTGTFFQASSSTTHSIFIQALFDNCIINGFSTEISNPSALMDDGEEPFCSWVKSTRHNRTDGVHISWFRRGSIRSDTTIFRTASPSERLTPNNASEKLKSGVKFVAVASGQTVTISAYVRESVVGDGTDYNGARPRLMLRKNLAMGITSDTVVDTATISSEGAFELLTGTTSSAARDGVLEFYIDCDGTTGWVNVDDWSAV